MILHPLLLGVVVGDLLGLAFLATAAWQTAGVLDGWQPTSDTPRQLGLERRVETAALLADLAFLCLCVGGLLLLVAICHTLVPLVPGAMCGTGVLQAAGTPGWRSLAFRALALVVLAGIRLIGGLNQATPTAPLALPLVKGLFLALPLCGWTLWDTAAAFLALDTHAPVSCCALVYDQVTPAAPGEGLSLLAAPLGPLTGVALLAATTGLLIGLLYGKGALARPLPLLAATALWLPLATTVLLTVFVDYHFQVLAHHCPWCLFLPEHKLVGYPLLGGLLLMALEAPVPWLARGLARRYPVSRQALARRIGQVRLRMTAAMGVYWMVGALPALLWRLRHGVWLG